MHLLPHRCPFYGIRVQLRRLEAFRAGPKLFFPSSGFLEGGGCISAEDPSSAVLIRNFRAEREREGGGGGRELESARPNFPENTLDATCDDSTFRQASRYEMKGNIRTSNIPYTCLHYLTFIHTHMPLFAQTDSLIDYTQTN